MNITQTTEISLKKNPFSLENKKIILFGSDSPTGKATSEILKGMGAIIIEENNSSETSFDGMVFFAENSARSFMKKTRSNNLEITNFISKRFINPFFKIQEAINNQILNEGASIIIEKISIDIANENPGYFNIEAGINSLISCMALNIANQKIRINIITAKNNPITSDNENFGYSAVYLLSPASRWVTGSEIVITGRATR